MNDATSSQRGFSMIEMLVGVLIISFGLLGLIQLQSRALQASVSSEDSQRAALLASEAAALMANRNSVILSDAAVQAWKNKASDPTAGGLPNGQGDITLTGDGTGSGTGTPTATITVQWTPPAGNTANDTRRYTTTVVVPK
jgi:type IV pilus assembly protein PilV